jgi:hypothetical protein
MKFTHWLRPEDGMKQEIPTLEEHLKRSGLSRSVVGHRPETDTTNALVKIIESQQKMIEALNERLMARSLPEYMQFRQAIENCPRIVDRIDELLAEVRAKQAAEMTFQRARNESVVPRINNPAEGVTASRV